MTSQWSFQTSAEVPYASFASYSQTEALDWCSVMLTFCVQGLQFGLLKQDWLGFLRIVGELIRAVLMCLFIRGLDRGGFSALHRWGLFERCWYGPGTTVPQREFLTQRGTYNFAILRKRILNDYHTWS